MKSQRNLIVAAHAALVVLLFSPIEAQGEMRVVFSTKPITTASPDGQGSALVTEFKLGDPIYSRVFSKDGKSINSHQSKPGSPLNFSLVYQVGDYNPRDPYRGDHYSVVLGNAGKSYVDVDLLPSRGARQKYVSQENSRPIPPPAEWLARRLIDFCKDGAKVVPVDFDMRNWGKYRFTVTCRDGGAAAAKRLAIQASIPFLDNRRMSRPSMRNAKLEKQMARTAAASPTRVGRGKVLRVVITEPAWKIERNARGHIKGRSIRAEVAFKGKDPTACRIESVGFAQAYAGGRFRKLHVPANSSETSILCRNVKK